jgi:hypothetical protein
MTSFGGLSYEQAKDAVRSTLKGGGSGRAAVFLITVAFLALGIYTGDVLLAALAGIATMLAAASLAAAWRSYRAARRLERAHSPARPR